MNYYYITGTSSGIGKALALTLLDEETNFVFGLSRNNTINHPRFNHVKIDLNDIDKANSFIFQEHSGATSVSLVNNAGILGPVNSVGKINPNEINEVLNVNFVSPFILTNSFIKKFQEETFVKIILNISSGAGRHPFESWSLYGASKASLDMMSRVIFSEQKLLPLKKQIRVFSVAPGIVDTEMQSHIRKTSKEYFPKLDTFIDYYKNKQLAQPDDVARKLVIILKHPDNYQDILLDARNL